MGRLRRLHGGSSVSGRPRELLRVETVGLLQKRDHCGCKSEKGPDDSCILLHLEGIQGPFRSRGTKSGAEDFVNPIAPPILIDAGNFYNIERVAHRRRRAR